MINSPAISWAGNRATLIAFAVRKIEISSSCNRTEKQKRFINNLPQFKMQVKRACVCVCRGEGKLISLKT